MAARLADGIEEDDFAGYMAHLGLAEIQPQAVEERLRELQVVDVREAAEWSGPLGHVAAAKHVPLGALAERAGSSIARVPSSPSAVPARERLAGGRRPRLSRRRGNGPQSLGIQCGRDPRL